MSHHVVAELVAASGYEDRLRTALESMIEPSLDEPGCLDYRLFVDPNSPGRMVVVEEWASAQALAEHFATPHFRHVAQVFETILAQPAVVRELVPATDVAANHAEAA